MNGINNPWILEASKHMGLKEIPGTKHNPTIVGWLQKLKAWWSDDETPWCGVFVAHCFRECKIELPKNWMRALAWADWGVRLDKPIPGCVVTFSRQGGGHVGFLVGETPDGFLAILGGNQGNAVTVAKFARSRVHSYQWPAGQALPASSSLPKIAINGAASTNEA